MPYNESAKGGQQRGLLFYIPRSQLQWNIRHTLHLVIHFVVLGCENQGRSYDASAFRESEIALASAKRDDDSPFGHCGTQPVPIYPRPCS